MVVFFPITSFLVIPSVQGTTIITVLAGILFMLLVAFPAGANKWLYMKELFVFFIIFLVFSIVSQYLNLLYDLKLEGNLVLVNKGGYMDYFYRPSHLTQALYLIISYIIYLFVKYYADSSIVKYIYWGLRLLCVYAMYEFIYYKITGANGDFVTNRKFGEMEASSFQLTNIAGVIMLRLKGYTGEPSMFTFTILPFWALAYGLNRKFDSALLLVCLIFSFSTTAYLSILLFFIAWFIYKKRYKQIIYIMAVVVALFAVLQLNAFREFADSIYNFVFGSKLSGESGSSQQRGGNMIHHIDYWTQLNFPSKLFGIGFGYIRSTDFFTTLLVNNGLLGLIVFSAFVFKNIRLNLPNRDLSFCYFAGLFILFFIMMATVPEFAYPSLWIYLGLGFIFSKYSKNFSNA